MRDDPFDLPPEGPALAPDRDDLEVFTVGLSTGEAQLLLARLLRETDADVPAMLANAWLMGATAARHAFSGRRVCNVCGCWHYDACVDALGCGCSWTGPNLCSACGPAGLPPPPRVA